MQTHPDIPVDQQYTLSNASERTLQLQISRPRVFRGVEFNRSHCDAMGDLGEAAGANMGARSRPNGAGEEKSDGDGVLSQTWAAKR